jgi:hypothetical protein
VRRKWVAGVIHDQVDNSAQFVFMRLAKVHDLFVVRLAMVCRLFIILFAALYSFEAPA